MGLNVVFLGTPEFAVASLDAIHKSDHHVSLVVTNPDKQAGRGQKIQESAVKKYALENNLAVFQPDNLKDISFIEEMKYLKPDIMVVVAFKILPKELYSIPKYGTFNLHASLLPKLRGASPINFAIINGEDQTGVTTFYIDEKVDTGNILLQEKIAVSPEETAGTLHDKLMDLGKDVVVETLNGIEDFSLRSRAQNDDKTTYAPKLDTIFCELFWGESLDYMERKVRGLSPYPGAWVTLEQNGDTKKLKIYSGAIEKEKPTEAPKKVIIEGNVMKIAHPEGYYVPTEVQLEGKKRMPVKDFINGLQEKDNLSIV